MGLFFAPPPRSGLFSLLRNTPCLSVWDRLTPGVDNNRYDVRLSPAFCRTLEEFILCVLEEYGHAR